MTPPVLSRELNVHPLVEDRAVLIARVHPVLAGSRRLTLSELRGASLVGSAEVIQYRHRRRLSRYLNAP